MELDTFTRAYIEAALWSSHDGDDGVSLESAGFTAEDFAPEALRAIIQECRDFQLENAVTLSYAGDDERNGHDFWLTRNRHGAGFWDRGYAPHIAQTLTTRSHDAGSRDLYVVDGTIYQS